MALEFVLHVSTDMDAKSALRCLWAMPGFELREDRDENSGEVFVIGAAIVVSAFESSSRRQSLVEQAFGFRPTITMWFRIQPKESYSEGKDSVLRATLALLQDSSRDGVLLFNGEEIVLQRIGGQLVFNQEFSNWEPSQLDRITALPYEIRKFPPPFP